MSYLAELEARWREKGGHLPNPSESRRSPALRGREFAMELWRLFAHTQDQRFRDAFAALIELDLVDEKLRWTNKLLPTEQEIEQTIADAVDDMMDSCGWSARRAHATFAAEAPLHANSFDAAIKKAQEIHRRLGRTVQRQSSNDNT